MSNHIEGIPTRVVVCAANRYGLNIFTGVRHFCPVMVVNMKYADIPWLRKEYGEEQGFIDQFGVFMSREEALEVAKEAGQINRWRTKTHPEHLLFSEDIY